MLLDRLIGEVSSRDDMGKVTVVLASYLFAFGKVNFEKTTVLAGELMEWVQAFDDPCSFGPTAADTRGKGDHSNPAVANSVGAEVYVCLVNRIACIKHISW